MGLNLLSTNYKIGTILAAANIFGSKQKNYFFERVFTQVEFSYNYWERSL